MKTACLICEYCREPILPGETIELVRNRQLHHECAFRIITGSVAHLTHQCSCFIPGSPCSDPPHLSKRQAAKAALETWKFTHPNP